MSESSEGQTVDTTMSTIENSISTSSMENEVSSSTLSPILEKIAEMITEHSETTENLDSSIFSSTPAILHQSSTSGHFNPIDYVVFGVMLAMSGEHLNFIYYLSTRVSEKI